MLVDHGYTTSVVKPSSILLNAHSAVKFYIVTKKETVMSMRQSFPLLRSIILIS